MNIFFAILFQIIQSNIYQIEFNSIDNNTISMSQFAGKKILLVNIATNSEKVGQLEALQQLHELYGDSVVIIGFPTNSFSHESRTDAEIKQYTQSNYGVSFLLAAKNPIAGPENQTLYRWLTTIAENGEMDDPIAGDFQKYLINKSGELVGVFAPSVSPMSNEIRNAIEY